MQDDSTDAVAGTGYPSDCEVTAGLREKARVRQEAAAGERGYVWNACLPRAKAIKLLLLDVDGVLTDGSIIYSHDGGETKSFNTRDGFGIRLLQKIGVEVGLITARESEAVSRRALDLKLRHVFQKSGNKLDVFRKITQELQLQPDEVAYMGDDWLDLPLLTRVGLAAAVADAAPEVRARVHYVTRRSGGHGAVREICDLIIAAKEMDQQLLADFID